MTISTVGDLIRAARTGRSQKEFADLLGVKQSSVSRYEGGKASPPVSVIEHCMRLVHTQADDAAPTADQLADRVRVVLADPALGQVRSALSRLVDAFVIEHAQTRTASAAPHPAGGRHGYAINHRMDGADLESVDRMHQGVARV